MYEKKIVLRLSVVSIVGNILLSAFKLFAGIAGHSAAMVSDAVHSLSDVLATAVAAIGVRVARKAPDRDHPYGHERLECVASAFLGLVLLATGGGIALSAAKTLLAGNYRESIIIPSAIALVAALVSIAVKESMYWYTRCYAKKINSPAFMADAWHHRSDALSSVGAVIGIGGAMLGVPVLEPIACLVICLFVLKVAIDILRDAVNGMVDTSGGEALEAELADFIRTLDGVERVDMLHTRKFASKLYIDAEISVDGGLNLYDAHTIAENVHEAVESRYPNIKHIMIHENPIAVGGDEAP